MLEAARQLRRKSTRSEAMLWRALRRKHFHGTKFRRQHPLGRFVLDFYCHEQRLAIEIDGSVHDTPDAIAHDGDRQTIIEASGIRVLRVRAEDVERNLSMVLRAIGVALSEPLPSSRRDDTLS
jgi:very-short-patch-repair endonuclease